MSKLPVFDMSHARQFTEARQALVREVLPRLKQQLVLKSALDVGCGVGYFSEFLNQMGFHVVGFDGRQENVAEAKSRFPQIDFLVADAEDPGIQRLGPFDLILCFGFLYHLENPFRAIRNLQALTAKVMFIESICVPERQPILRLLDENHGHDQGLRYVALYPSETCLIKMLYQSGFPFVYRLSRSPAHEDFRRTPMRNKRRTMLVASRLPLASPLFTPVEESKTSFDPWTTWCATMWHYIAPGFHHLNKISSRFIGGLLSFSHKSWLERRATVRKHFGLH